MGPVAFYEGIPKGTVLGNLLGNGLKRVTMGMKSSIEITHVTIANGVTVTIRIGKKRCGFVCIWS